MSGNVSTENKLKKKKGLLVKFRTRINSSITEGNFSIDFYDIRGNFIGEMSVWEGDGISIIPAHADKAFNFKSPKEFFQSFVK